MLSLKSLVTLLILCVFNPDPTLQFSGFEKYSQPCKHNDQCSGADFRLICHQPSAVCQCSRFYYWNEEFRECHLNATQLNLYFDGHKERHISDELNNDAAVAFLSIALAGIVSLSLGLALSILCVLYACLFRNVVHPVLPQHTGLKVSPPQPRACTQKTK